MKRVIFHESCICLFFQSATEATLVPPWLGAALGLHACTDSECTPFCPDPWEARWAQLPGFSSLTRSCSLWAFFHQLLRSRDSLCSPTPHSLCERAAQGLCLLCARCMCSVSCAEPRLATRGPASLLSHQCSWCSCLASWPKCPVPVSRPAVVTGRLLDLRVSGWDLAEPGLFWPLFASQVASARSWHLLVPPLPRYW